MSHIAVERNRRRQMNEHLKVLRSMTPCFYIKKGDQASIIGGVIEFIKEMQVVLQSLESKKRRRSISPSPGPSPKPITIQPSTPQSERSIIVHESIKELGASSNSPIADVEAKMSGSNVVLRTVSRKIRGQVVKIINLLENLSFEILHLNISSMEDTVLYSFVIKIGLECQLSVEELAVEVQKSFSLNHIAPSIK
uniref:transcription factor MUTE n=1 Tax=Erigeron canadensis TaxID=72917 RepID=UPI001CB91E8D|nr:transcription factor MUTE [Erigeron canadensis]